MIPPDGQRIIQQVAKEQYEDALGVLVAATPAEINRAHLLIAHRFRDYLDVKSAINSAQATLFEEDDAEKGRRLSRIGKKEEALPYLRKAVEKRGDANDHLWLGSTLAQLGRREEALPYLIKAVEKRGDAIDHSWLGSTLAQLGRREEALPHLIKAVEKRGDAADHDWLRITLAQMGR